MNLEDINNISLMIENKETEEIKNYIKLKNMISSLISHNNTTHINHYNENFFYSLVIRSDANSILKNMTFIISSKTKEENSFEDLSISFKIKKINENLIVNTISFGDSISSIAEIKKEDNIHNTIINLKENLKLLELEKDIKINNEDNEIFLNLIENLETQFISKAQKKENLSSLIDSLQSEHDLKIVEKNNKKRKLN